MSGQLHLQGEQHSPKKALETFEWTSMSMSNSGCQFVLAQGCAAGQAWLRGMVRGPAMAPVPGRCSGDVSRCARLYGSMSP